MGNTLSFVMIFSYHCCLFLNRTFVEKDKKSEIPNTMTMLSIRNPRIGVESYILDIPIEMIRNYEASGITFLESYVGEVVSVYTYYLQEKDTNGERLKAVLFESEEDIIGGYIILPSWTPAIFSLDEKERLIDEELIQQ